LDAPWRTSTSSRHYSHLAHLPLVRRKTLVVVMLVVMMLGFPFAACFPDTSRLLVRKSFLNVSVAKMMHRCQPAVVFAFTKQAWRAARVWQVW